MFQQLISLAYDLKDRDVSPLLKRLLNVLFISGITSFVFKTYYFDYELIDILDYKAYYFFFVNGDFVVPFSIFFVLWSITKYISFIIFKLLNFYVSLHLRTKIIRFSFFQNFPSHHESSAQSLIHRPILDSDEGINRLFFLIKNSLNKMDLRKLRKFMDKVQDELETDFTLLIRALIACIIFFVNVPHFGWLLLTLSILGIGFYGILLFIMYQLAEIVPVVLSKTISEIENYFSLINNTNQVDETTVDIEIDQK